MATASPVARTRGRSRGRTDLNQRIRTAEAPPQPFVCWSTHAPTATSRSSPTEFAPHAWWQPLNIYDWRDGTLAFECPDEEPPTGFTTCLHRASTRLAAGNSDTHSQLRVWDLGSGTLVDRFCLPPYCKGVRCVAASSEQTLVAGCANGWVVWFDLRSGRYERKLAHTDCVNALAAHGPYLISAGDDKLVRVSDLRRDSFAPFSAHRVSSTVFSMGVDHEATYVGCDNGDCRVFDYSAAANPQNDENAGGFSSQQKEALANAIATSRRLPRRR